MENVLETDHPGTEQKLYKRKWKTFICCFGKSFHRKKKNYFVSVAKACFLWGISYAGEVTPRWSCAEDMVAPLPRKARREKPSSPTPSLWTARRPLMNYGGRWLMTPLQLLFSVARRPVQALAPPAALLTTEPLLTPFNWWKPWPRSSASHKAWTHSLPPLPPKYFWMYAARVQVEGPGGGLTPGEQVKDERAGWGDGSGPRDRGRAQLLLSGQCPQQAAPAAGSALLAGAGRPAWQGRAVTRRPREGLRLRGDPGTCSGDDSGPALLLSSQRARLLPRGSAPEMWQPSFRADTRGRWEYRF